MSLFSMFSGPHCEYWDSTGKNDSMKPLLDGIAVGYKRGTILGEGSFGRVYKYTHEGTDYAVKEIKDKHYNGKFFMSMSSDDEEDLYKEKYIRDFNEEIASSIKFTSLIPEHVTPFIGARYCDNNSNDIIVYKYIEGDNLNNYIKIIYQIFDHDARSIGFDEHQRYEYGSPAYTLIEELYNNLSYLWCALEKANVALNDKGWSHNDIKPANLYYHIDRKPDGSFIWSSAKCYLIDFGASKQFGQKIDVRTNIYSMCHTADRCPFVSPDRIVRLNPDQEFKFNAKAKQNQQVRLSQRFNATSRNVIWLKDFLGGQYLYTDNRYYYASDFGPIFYYEKDLTLKYPEFKDPHCKQTGGKARKQKKYRTRKTRKGRAT